MRLLLPLLLLALPASAQFRSPPAYDGSAPGHPADEPGPELGATAEDAFALLKRGDRDAARLSAARCLRGDAADERCRLVVEAVEAGIEAPKLSPVRADLYRADLHLRAGADWYFHGHYDDARREWDACRRLDPGNPFCALGQALTATARSKSEARRPAGTTAKAPALEPKKWPIESRVADAKAAYLAGVVYFQRGEYDRSRGEWSRCLKVLPQGHEEAADCRAGLDKLKQLYGE